MSRLHSGSILACLILASGFLHSCTSTDDDPGDPADPTPEIVELEPSATMRTAAAAHLQMVLADSIEAWTDTPTPIGVAAPPKDLVDLIETEFPDFDLLGIAVDQDALSTRPLDLGADDLSFHAIRDASPRAGLGDRTVAPAYRRPAGDSELKDAVGDLIELVDGTGLDTRELENAWSSTRFHDAAHWPGGLPSGTGDAAVHLWDNSLFWNASWHDGWVFFWADGFNHIILASRHVATLKNRQFVDTEGQLPTAAASVLHELAHVILSRTHCAVDDNEDVLVSKLERVMVNRIEIELARQNGGTPRAADAGDYSDHVADLVELGGTNCLRDLGWGLPAGDLTLLVPETVQTGQMYTLEFSVRQIGGNPAASAAAWTWVQSAIEPVVTDGLGVGRRALVAPNEPGTVRIRVKCWGQDVETTVRVVGDPVGACCQLGECTLTTQADCVSMDGTWGGTTSTCTPNPCPQPGACCYPLGDCAVVADSAACAAGEGAWQGASTSCDAAPCPQASGSCCLPDGSCSVTAPNECDGAFTLDGACTPNPCPQPGACCIGTVCTITQSDTCDGEFQGTGSGCEPDPCVLPGACCAPDGNCAFVLESACNGTFQGEGSFCAPNPCPRPGACCDGEGDCLVTLATTCDGTFQGQDTACDPNPCPQPPQGACCWGVSNERCAIRSATRCETELDGVYLGDGTNCFSDPCTDPLAGGCCLPSGTCLFIRQNLCDGTFLGVGVPCSPEACGPPTNGACCFELGSCQILSQATCLETPGVYQGDGTVCTPNPCPQPGACCSSSGVCQILDEGPCENQGGTYLGAGTSCTPNPCMGPVMGACCLAEGACQVTTAADCTEFGGAYQGNGSTCTPNPCPQPGQGACCNGAACTIQTQASCITNDGVYQGDGTDCDPNPCPQPAQGACCFELGSCQILSQATCLETPGVYQGDGTVCTPNPCPQPGACCSSSGVCQILDEGPCVSQSGTYQGNGTTCTPNPCTGPKVAQVTLVSEGYTHDIGFSIVCLLLQISGVDLDNGGTVTIEFTTTDPGTQVFPVSSKGEVEADRTIFSYGVHDWRVTHVQSRAADYEVEGDTQGSVTVGPTPQPCHR